MEDNIYEFYQVNEDNPTVFSFNSIGLREIKKIVTFEYGYTMHMRNVYNLVLSDEKEDGTLDAEVESNNGDIFKVLDTVAAILEYFLSITVNTAVYIKGADDRRINVYQWRITRSLEKYAINYNILGQKYRPGPFEKLNKAEHYVGFLVIPQG